MLLEWKIFIALLIWGQLNYWIGIVMSKSDARVGNIDIDKSFVHTNHDIPGEPPYARLPGGGFQPNSLVDTSNWTPPSGGSGVMPAEHTVHIKISQE